MSLKQKTISGVRWTTFSSAINAILQLLQLMILARYLSPHDFGLVAILMVIVGFSQIFVDFGLSKAIIYKQKITHNQLSTLYWLNIILSIFIFLIIVIFSAYIAQFYNESGLDNLIIIISTSFVIQAFGQQYRTLFQKELQFNILAKIDVFAAIVSFITAIVLAINNFGVYSLICPIIVMTFIKTILLVYFGLSSHKPNLYFDIKEVKEFLSFGGYTVGNGIVSTVATQVDILIIGKLLGTETLGLYSIIKELILRPSQLINPIITKVAFPAMSKVNHDIDKIRSVYLRLINYISSVNFPVYIASFILAPEIITIFLGEKWLNGVVIFKIFSIWALIRAIGNPIGSLVMAMGKPQYEMYWNILMMFFTPFMVYISSFWGVEGVAWGNLISIIILFIPEWYFLTYKLCKASLKEYFLSSFYPFVLSSIVGMIIYLLLNLYDGNIIYKFIVTIVAGFTILWLLYRKYNQDFFITLLSMLKRNP